MATSIPRRKRFNREQRLQSARHWVKTYSGRDIVRGYRKWYGVSTVCAILELRQLGFTVSEDRLAQARVTEAQTARRRAVQKEAARSEEENLDSDLNFAYIAGYTEGGAPYGVTWDEVEAVND